MRRGVTPDQLTGWLRDEGWEPENVGWSKMIDGGRVTIGSFSDALLYVDRTAQEVLREINPRLLPGLPSEAAREAHRCGLWLAQPDFDCIGAVVCIVVSLHPDEEGFSVWYPEGFEFADKKTEKRASKWKFWPCDENGNKVRWPERDGKML